MRAFASFILRGRLNAILVAVSAAVLALLLPLLGHIGGAAVALVTLRKGYREGLLVALGGGLILGIVGAFSTVSQPLVVAFLVSTVAAMWLPVVVAAEVLRLKEDQGKSLAAVAVLAFLAIVALQLVVEDPAAWWRGMLETVLSPMLAETAMPLSEADMNRMLDSLAEMMTGLMGAALVYSTMVSLFIGRWLQAMLFNPGGFGSEFHRLRLRRNVAIAALGILLFVSFASGAMETLANNLLLLMVAVYSFHGLALAHAVVALTRAHVAWLVVLYLLILFMLPQAMIALSAAGFADSWVDFRSLIRKKPKNID